MSREREIERRIAKIMIKKVMEGIQTKELEEIILKQLERYKHEIIIQTIQDKKEMELKREWAEAD